MLPWAGTTLTWKKIGAPRDMRKQAAAIPVVNMANEKRAGGD
jgi:hypothetical protein